MEYTGAGTTPPGVPKPTRTEDSRMTTKTTTLSGLSLAVAAAALFLGAPIANAGQTATAKTGHCKECQVAGGKFEMPKPAKAEAKKA